MLVSPSTLSNWTLIIELWTPPTEFYNVEEGPMHANYIFQLLELIPWNDISLVIVNISRLGCYLITFTWPQLINASNDMSGAIIDIGAITNTARVTVNEEVLPPLDTSWARNGIRSLLQQGENTVQVVVSTPLGNGLRSYWDEVMTSGKLATASVPSPPSEAKYGLLAPMQIIPYRKDEVS
jgi:hypothetical protein